MLHVLPTEVTLIVLSHLPIPSLLSLPILSHQWSDFFTTNQSAIFHSVALLHGYTQPGTLLLEDALSVNTGRPWAGSTSWKDFCYRSFQLRKNWEGRGRAVARVLSPPGFDVRRIKVDEKVGICITTHNWGGLFVTHLFTNTVLWGLSRSYLRSYTRCEYDNGYLVFNRCDGAREVWRLASDFATEGEVSVSAPPDGKQMSASAHAATVFHRPEPLGQFRPWALLTLPDVALTYRLAYPTLICANRLHAYLHDVRTGSLIQTIGIRLRNLYDVDVSERHAFMCELDAVHVFSRDSSSEVLRVPARATIQCSQFVENPVFVHKDTFITPLSVSPKVCKSRPRFIAVHVSRDGRDLVVLSYKRRVVYIRDFERICRGETSLERAGLVLKIRPQDRCCYLGFEHGRVCVATVEGLYIFTFGLDLSAKAVFVRTTNYTTTRSDPIKCMQLTDRHIYFTWQNAMRRQDIPLFEDAENARELPSSLTPALDRELQLPLFVELGIDDKLFVGCIDFTLMPEGYASEI